MVKSSQARKGGLIGLGVVPLALLMAFWAGPRVAIETTIHPVTLPKDLDRYVADAEAAFQDIIPGTEKTIVWAGEAGAATPMSVVYLHGFSASRQETAPLADRVAAALGANLFCTRFTGHGRGGVAMLEGSVNAWLNDTHQALQIGRRLGQRVIILASSTGGTAATWLAARPFAEDVAAFVLMAPNFAPADPRSHLLLWPWGGQLAEFFIGPERSWEPHNALQEAYWTHRYPTRALLPMMGLVHLAASSDLAAITTPMLVIYSPSDRVVSARAIEKTFGKIGSARKQLLRFADADDPSQHVLAGDILSPRSTDTIARIVVDFIKKHAVYRGK